MQKRKRYGDKGSPCLNPLEGLKKESGEPFMRTTEVVVVMHYIIFFAPLIIETHLFHNSIEENPINSVKSFCHVNLYTHIPILTFGTSFGSYTVYKFMSNKNIVRNLSPRYERRLVRGYYFVGIGFHSLGYEFGNDFIGSITEADRSELTWGSRIFHFGNERYEGCIHFF